MGELAQETQAVPHSHHRQPDPSLQLRQVLGGVAGQFMLLEVSPDPLLWVQLGAVSWKSVHLPSTLLAQEGTRKLGPVVRPIVPEEHDRPPPDVPEEVLQERDHLRPVDRPLPHLQVEVTTGGDPSDGRDLRPSPLVHQHRGLPHRGSGLRTVGDERETALVHEDDYGLRLWAIFEAGPSGALPALYLGEILLPSLTRKALPGEVVLLEEQPHVAPGVVDPPLLLQEPRDPGQGPEVSVIPVAQGTAGQDLPQTGERLLRYEGMSSTARLGPEGKGAPLFHRSLPVVDSLGSHGETPRHLNRGNPLTE